MNLYNKFNSVFFSFYKRGVCLVSNTVVSQSLFSSRAFSSRAFSNEKLLLNGVGIFSFMLGLGVLENDVSYCNNIILEFMVEILLIIDVVIGLAVVGVGRDARLVCPHKGWFCSLLFYLGLLMILFKMQTEVNIHYYYGLISCGFTIFTKIVILSIVILLFVVGQKHLKQYLDRLSMELVYLVTVFCLIFSFLLLSTYNFFLAYLCIEGLTISALTLVILCSWNNTTTDEAIVKYVVVNLLGTSALLYGQAFLPSFGFDSVVNSITLGEKTLVHTRCLLAMYFTLVGLLVKLAAFPAYMWGPDVYEGVSLLAAAILMLVVKTTYLFFFIRVFYYVFGAYWTYWSVYVLVAGLGSLIVGSSLAMYQMQVKRFLGYASISQVGYILCAMSTGNSQGLESAILYTLIYVLSSLLVFYLLLGLITWDKKESMESILNFQGACFGSNFSGAGLLILFFSMLGLPPFAGFMVKLFILVNLFNNFAVFSIFFVLGCSTLGAVYYLNTVASIGNLPKFLNESLITTWNKKAKDKLVQAFLDSMNITVVVGIIFLAVSYLALPEILSSIEVIARDCNFPDVSGQV